MKFSTSNRSSFSVLTAITLRTLHIKAAKIESIIFIMKVITEPYIMYFCVLLYKQQNNAT